MVETAVKHNKTTRYLLPLLKLDINFFRTLKRNGFVSLYLEDAAYQKATDNCIFLLMKPLYLNEDFNIVDERLKANKLFHDFYEVDADTFMYVFKLVSDEEIRVLENFWLSKFSKMTALLKYFEPVVNGKICEEYHSIKKSQEYKKYLENKFNVSIDDSWELGECLNYNEEIYRYNE